MRAAAVLGLLGALLVLTGCQREQRRFSEVAPASGRPDRLRASGFNPGDRQAPAEFRNPYERNAWAAAEGKRLYAAFNCIGCHANGGGGIGPPLMDPAWIYGGEPVEIYASIVEGRPNGMPAFGGRITDSQAWQLVTYVQSMSGLLRKDVRPSRSDHMSVRPSEQSGTSERRKPPQ
ncbi:MAG: cytochrome C [Candidatus Rokuibacteriota bacterium]|nr:MAG: cytochrome C [Candidatus Rokubacteria bacterium]